MVNLVTLKKAPIKAGARAWEDSPRGGFLHPGRPGDAKHERASLPAQPQSRGEDPSLGRLSLLKNEKPFA